MIVVGSYKPIVKPVLGAVGLVTSRDVARLERRLELLEKRLRRTSIRLEILNRKWANLTRLVFVHAAACFLEVVLMLCRGEAAQN